MRRGTATCNSLIAGGFCQERSDNEVANVTNDEMKVGALRDFSQPCCPRNSRNGSDICSVGHEAGRADQRFLRRRGTITKPSPKPSRTKLLGSGTETLPASVKGVV